MAPHCWFSFSLLLITSLISSYGAEEDRVQRAEEDDDLETAIVGIAPWAAILPISGGERGSRQLVSFRPRLGREEEVLAESSRSPPFAPRLGRFYAPFSPRLGRRRS
ncbi:PBAN-type neuropeptides [Halyomorpha halys]|uniref:PK n=1 Tax=Halyomorpha halys TaxID=286706 RepID=A0A3G3E7Z2_HALHY|nr:PBAN-type neuropeptides-like [Halyomorpha halys]AYP97818.1 PK [Halyomorpha halys]